MHNQESTNVSVQWSTFVRSPQVEKLILGAL
jgi:hypothetical protein